MSTHNEICKATLKKLYGFYARKTQLWIELKLHIAPKIGGRMDTHIGKKNTGVNLLSTIQIWTRRKGILQNKHTYPGSVARSSLKERWIIRF